MEASSLQLHNVCLRYAIIFQFLNLAETLEKKCSERNQHSNHDGQLTSRLDIASKCLPIQLPPALLLLADVPADPF